MNSAEIAKWTVAAAFAGVLLVAAAVDIRSRRIPNLTVAMLILVYVAANLLQVSPTVWWGGLAAAAITLAITYALYHFGIVGAGDAKLMSAGALFAGLEGLSLFALMTVLVGGVMAVGVIALNPKRALRGMTAAGRADGHGRGIPYGVAIAIGGIVSQVIIPGGLGAALR